MVKDTFKPKVSKQKQKELEELKQKIHANKPRYLRQEYDGEPNEDIRETL